MDVDAYLERIAYDGPRAPSADALAALQQAHLRSVPFENLSIHAGEPIVLDEAALFDKVVTRRRGGFCYELNGTFGRLLRALGYDVVMISAEVASGDGYSPPFDHMALLVQLDARWLVDVGFGDAFRAPLRLVAAVVQAQPPRAYRLTQDGRYYVLHEQRPGHDWQRQYRFTTRAYQLRDYASRCRFHQTSADSHFTQRRLCTRATLTGRITLAEDRLIITTLDGDRTETPLTATADATRLLRERFGINQPWPSRWRPAAA